MSYPGWRSNRGSGWDPFGELQALRSELGRLMGSALVGRGGSGDVDLDTDDDGWRVTARLPGVAPEEVAVEVEGRELVIRARTEDEVNADLGVGGGDRKRAFEYRVALPAEIDPDRVDAVMDHGLLTVRVPRMARGGRRTIAVGRRRPAVEGGPATVDTDGYGEPAEQAPAEQAAAAQPPSPADPAADREMHHPDVADREEKQ